MKAHPNDQLALLKLAEIDAAHGRLQHLAKHMPEQEHLIQLEADRRARRAAAAEAVGALEDARSELARIQADAAVVAERKRLDDERLATATSTKDIAALEAELATLRRRGSELDDLELAQLEALDGLEQTASTARESMREIEELAADLLERRDQARENLRAEAKELHSRRQAQIAEIPAELLAVYEDVRAKQGIGACELVGDVSTATNEAIGPAEMSRIRGLAADEVTFCPTTGAVLVRTARSHIG